MVVHRPGVILERLRVPHRLYFPLDRLIPDLAVSLTQPVAIRVDALLASLAVLPHLVTLGTLGMLKPWGRMVWI